MTPFHIRRRIRGALTSLPGPLGSVATAILGRPEAGAPPATERPAPPPPPAPARASAPIPDPRDEDDRPSPPPPPAYTPEEEAALKKSKPTPRGQGQENVVFWQVARRGDVPPNTGKTVKALDREYALFNVDGEYHAIDNACPHAQGSLGMGELDGKVVTCSQHGWAFDVTTGECVSRPGNRVEVVPVRFDGERILLPV